ncbi:hypothetical protein BGC_12530 [Burkholderia sp. 3C]
MTFRMPITSGRSNVKVKRPHCKGGGAMEAVSVNTKNPEAETKRAGVNHTGPLMRSRFEIMPAQSRYPA